MDLPSGLDELPTWLSGKESTCQFRRHRISRTIPGSGDLLEEKWPSIPTFLPGKSHEQRSLVDYSSRGCKESDTAEQLTHTHTHTHTHIHTPPGPNTQQKCNKYLWDEWTKTWINYTESINLFSQLESELRERRDLLKLTFGKRQRGDSNQSPIHSQVHVSPGHQSVCQEKFGVFKYMRGSPILRIKIHALMQSWTWLSDWTTTMCL